MGSWPNRAFHAFFPSRRRKTSSRKSAESTGRVTGRDARCRTAADAGGTVGGDLDAAPSPAGPVSSGRARLPPVDCPPTDGGEGKQEPRRRGLIIGSRSVRLLRCASLNLFGLFVSLPPSHSSFYWHITSICAAVSASYFPGAAARLLIRFTRARASVRAMFARLDGHSRLPASA